MNWPKLALVILVILTAVFWVLPWIGIDVEAWPDSLRWALVVPFLIALFLLGRDERQREKEEDTWVDDPRKTKFENWRDKRRQRFSPKRGLGFFVAGLVVFSIIVVLNGGVASIGAAVAFVLGMSVLAGLIGMFTEKVPL